MTGSPLHRGNRKTGKMAKKKNCQGKHREFEILPKTQGILFAHLVSSLILKINKDFVEFAAKISNFSSD